MAPAAGRTFSAVEEQPTGPGAAVISDRFWLRRFGRDPGAIGRTLTIGGRPYEIVGAMPAAFTGAAIDLWLPAQTAPQLLAIREARFLGGIARLRPGLSVQAGAQDLAAVQRQLATEFPATDAGWSVEIQPLKNARLGDARRGLVLVFAAVAALWLIAVANIAGLTLVHVYRRARELAIRAALGASRVRVAAAVMREGVMVAAAGAALGTLIAAWLISLMPALFTRTPRITELAFDGRVLIFTLVTGAIAACAFGLVPALAGSRAGLGRVLALEGRSVALGSHRLQRGLVVAQVALSVLLVGSATLLLRGYYDLSRVDTGFDASGVLTFHVGARWDEDRTRVGELQEQLLAGLSGLPHVQAAGMTNFLPAMGATLRYQVRLNGIAGPNADGSMTVGSRMVSGGYLRAIRAPLVAGTWCEDASRAPNASVSAMVNRRFVETFAADRPVVGATLRTLQGLLAVFTISGVVGNIAEDGAGTAPAPYVYFCTPAGSWPDPEYVVRTTAPHAFTADLRRVVRELDPERAIFGLRPLADVVESALDQPRLDATMIGVFAGAAVVLAAIGLYSLFMLVVSDRAREMAVRLAIGAEPRQVIGLVMAGAGRLLATGLVLGVVLTAAADRFFRASVFGVRPIDISAVASAIVVLAVVAVIAVAGPARRAARIAPLTALKD
jgi:putative ABC transport system permease protein